MVEVVEEEAPDREVAQVVEARGRGALRGRAHAELVVVGVIRERDVREEAAGLVLQVAKHREMLDAVLVATRRGRRASLQFVRMPRRVRHAVHLDPVLGDELLLGDRRAHALAEHFGAAARQRVEPRLAQRDEHFAIRHLLDARDVRDLDGGERLDVHVRVALP